MSDYQNPGQKKDKANENQKQNPPQNQNGSRSFPKPSGWGSDKQHDVERDNKKK